jgi:hypothetical protein
VVTKKQITKILTNSLSKDRFYAFQLELGKDNPPWPLFYISYDMHMLGAYSICIFEFLVCLHDNVNSCMFAWKH